MKNLSLCSLAIVLQLVHSCVTPSRYEKLENQLQEMKNQVSRVEKNQNQQLTSSNKAVVNSLNEVQNLQSQLQMLLGTVDELKTKITRLEDPTLNNKKVNDVRELEKLAVRLQLMLEISEKEKSSSKLPGKLNNLQELQKTLSSDFNLSNFKQVIITSNLVLTSQDSNDDMKEVALRYRAESYFQLKDYPRAAVDFSNFSERFDRSAKLSRMLLLAGDSYVYLGKQKVAYYYYEQCTKNFPLTNEGKAAQERLSRLETP